MSIGELYSKSFINYRKTGFFAHVLHFFLMLVATGFLLLGLFYSSLFLIVVPVIVVPLLFTSQFSSLLLIDQGVMTAKMIYKGLGLYFSEKYYSTYRVIKSALFSLMIYVGFTLIYGVIVNLSLYAINYMNFQSIFADFLAHIDVTTDELMLLYQKYYDFFEVLTLINAIPSTFVFCFSFIIISGRHSVSLFHRILNTDYLGSVSKTIQEKVMKKYSKDYNKAFFGLHLSTLIIYIVSFGLGVLVGYLHFKNYTGTITLGIAFSTFITFGLYGPFVLAFNRTIYYEFEDKYVLEFENMKNQLSLTLEDLLNKMEEDRKKDSDEP